MSGSTRRPYRVCSSDSSIDLVPQPKPRSFRPATNLVCAKKGPRVNKTNPHPSGFNCDKLRHNPHERLAINSTYQTYQRLLKGLGHRLTYVFASIPLDAVSRHKSYAVLRLKSAKEPRIPRFATQFFFPHFAHLRQPLGLLFPTALAFCSSNRRSTRYSNGTHPSPGGIPVG